MRYDSIIEESLTRALQCVLDQRVRIFKELCEDWSLECQIAKEGYTLFKKAKSFHPTKFNVPLLRSIATGHIFDRTFASPNEDYEPQVRESKECVQYLEEGLKKHEGNPELPISKYTRMEKD